MEQGLIILNNDGFNIDNDIDMTCLSTFTISQAVIQICDKRADALFISCAALRSPAAIKLWKKTEYPSGDQQPSISLELLAIIENRYFVPGFGRLFDLISF